MEFILIQTDYKYTNYIRSYRFKAKFRYLPRPRAYVGFDHYSTYLFSRIVQEYLVFLINAESVQYEEYFSKFLDKNGHFNLIFLLTSSKNHNLILKLFLSLF